jgi:hypothetical protein
MLLQVGCEYHFWGQTATTKVLSPKVMSFARKRYSPLVTMA